MSTATLSPPETVTKTVAVEIPTEGLVRVSLLQVDTTHFPNYRKRATEEHISELMKTIKEQGQLTPCGGSWNEDATKIYLWSGHCRIEAMTRLALSKVVAEYNESIGKKSGDDGYVPLGGKGFESRKDRDLVRQAGPQWAEKFDAALRAYSVNFSVQPVVDQNDAAIKGMVANIMDKPPLLDTMEKIVSIIEGGAKQKDVAKAMGMTEPGISQYKRAYKVPTALRELFTNEKDFGLKTPEDIAAERKTMLAAVDEYERRLALPLEHDQVIKISHARPMSELVVDSKESIPTAAIGKILKFLVQLNDRGEPTKNSTPDTSLFILKVKELRKPTPAPEAPATTEKKEGGTTPAVAAPAASVPQDVSDAFDKAAATHGQVSTGKEGATTTPPAATPTPTVGATPTLSPEDKAKVAEVEAANDGIEQADLTDAELDDMAPTTDDLLGEEAAAETAEAATPAEAEVTDGQMKSKPKEDLSGKYKILAPEKIEQRASRLYSYCERPDVGENSISLSQRVSYLMASNQLFTVVGLTAEANVIQDQWVNYSESVRRYYDALENAVKEARGEAFLADMKKLVPAFERKSLAAPTA